MRRNQVLIILAPPFCKLLNYIRLNPFSCLVLHYGAALSAKEQGWHVEMSEGKSQGMLRSNTSGKGRPVLAVQYLTVLQLLSY